jgi:DNA polymerase III subunit beta
MKLECSQNDLSGSLSLVSRAIATRPSHPILANVLLAADAGTQRLSLTGFDLSLGIQTSFAAQVEQSGAITLPAKLLGDIVSRLPSEGPIALSDTEGKGLVVLSSQNGEYQVRGMGAEEYPELPLVQTGEAVQLSAEALIEGLRGTLFATSSDESKQILTGVHVKVQPDGLEFAATDGHRLAVVVTENVIAGVESPMPDGDAPSEGFAVTVPARALRDLERMLVARVSGEPIALYFDQGQIVFQWGDQYLTSRTLDGQYPNYGQLIPREFSRQVTVERKAFLSALERIAVLADQRSNIVKVELLPEQSKLALSVDAQDIGRGQESVVAQISGDSLAIAFNVRYLMDGLKALPGNEVQIRLNGATQPVILEPLVAKMTYLVMPVQVRG